MHRRYGTAGQSISSTPPSSPVTVNDGRLPRSDSAERGQMPRRIIVGVLAAVVAELLAGSGSASAQSPVGPNQDFSGAATGTRPKRGGNYGPCHRPAGRVGAARRVGSGDVHRGLSREGDPARVAVALLGNWAGGVHAQAQQPHGAGCDRDYPLPQRRRLSWQPPRKRVDGRTSWLARGLVSPASGVYVSCLRRKLEAAGEPRLRHNVGGRGAALREDW